MTVTCPGGTLWDQPTWGTYHCSYLSWGCASERHPSMGVYISDSYPSGAHALWTPCWDPRGHQQPPPPFAWNRDRGRGVGAGGGGWAGMPSPAVSHDFSLQGSPRRARPQGPDGREGGTGKRRPQGPEVDEEPREDSSGPRVAAVLEMGGGAPTFEALCPSGLIPSGWGLHTPSG